MISKPETCSYPIGVPWIGKNAIKHKIHVSHLHCRPTTKSDREAQFSTRHTASGSSKVEGCMRRGRGGERQQTCLERRLLESSRRDWPASALAASPPHPGHRTHSAQRESETQGEHHAPGWDGLVTTGGAQQAGLHRARLLLYPSLKTTSCVTLGKLLNHSDPQLHHW